MVDAYLAAVPAVRLLPELPGVPVAYTAMHGVGGDDAAAPRSTAPGSTRRTSWPPSSEPERPFPTVSFPNPEEPGAMDLLLALAAERGARVAIANDPDADRLGAAIPQPDGSWRRLTATRSAGCWPTTSCATPRATTGS